MPTPDLDERFRRWLKLIAEMHDGANFTANQTISWTPLRKPLSECCVALVSTAGVHLKSQPAHGLLNPHGDASFREIPGYTHMSDMAVDHELVSIGMIGAVAPMHYGFMGFIPDGRLLRDTTAPIVAEPLLAQQTDVLLEQLVEIKEPGTIVELPFRWRRM